MISENDQCHFFIIENDNKLDTDRVISNISTRTDTIPNPKFSQNTTLLQKKLTNRFGPAQNPTPNISKITPNITTKGSHTGHR